MKKINRNTQLVSAGRKKAYTQGVVNPVVQRASTVVFDSVAELKEAAKNGVIKHFFMADEEQQHTLHYKKPSLNLKVAKAARFIHQALRRLVTLYCRL